MTRINKSGATFPATSRRARDEQRARVEKARREIKGLFRRMLKLELTDEFRAEIDFINKRV